MKKTLISATIIALTITSSFAQASKKTEPKVVGFYFGGVYGTSKLKIDRIDLSGGKKAKNTSFSASDRAFKLLAGYQFEPIIGIEGAFANLNDFQSGRKIKVYSVSANLGYTYPNGIRPFALLGLGDVKTIYSNDLSLHYGAGLEFTPANSKGVAFRALYEVDIFTNKENEPINEKFELSTFTVGATYKF